MRRICWPAWISAVAMVAFVLLASGCQASPAVVPAQVYEQVNADGREWTYDTAWQNIRKINANLDDGTVNTLREDALLVTSQMERLERGKAGPLTNRQAAQLIQEASETANLRDFSANLQHAREVALKLQDTFDAGDFEAAQRHALEVYVIAGALLSED